MDARQNFTVSKFSTQSMQKRLHYLHRVSVIAHTFFKFEDFSRQRLGLLPAESNFGAGCRQHPAYVAHEGLRDLPLEVPRCRQERQVALGRLDNLSRRWWASGASAISFRPCLLAAWACARLRRISYVFRIEETRLRAGNHARATR